MFGFRMNCCSGKQEPYSKEQGACSGERLSCFGILLHSLSVLAPYSLDPFVVYPVYMGSFRNLGQTHA